MHGRVIDTRNDDSPAFLRAVPKSFSFVIFVCFVVSLFFTTKVTKDVIFHVTDFREGEAPAEPHGLVIVNGRSGSAGASPSRDDSPS
jgi:hypothetical protein